MSRSTAGFRASEGLPHETGRNHAGNASQLQKATAADLAETHYMTQPFIGNSVWDPGNLPDQVAVQLFQHLRA